MKKSIDINDVEEQTGPMNSVAKEDALVLSGIPEDADLENLDPRKLREFRAKKFKMRRSTIKRDRAIAKMAGKLF